MPEIPLNKFEKRDLVIKLHKEGKTYREIAHIARISPRDIKSILKKYERKLENNKRNRNHQETTKANKLSLGSQAFTLFKSGKKPIDVKIELDIPFVKARKFWAQFLNLEKMEECFDLYTEYRYDIPTLLSIGTFMKRNNVSGNNDVLNTLRTANDINNLNQTYHNLKTEIKDLEQRRNYLLYSPISPYSLQPLPLNKQKYNYNYYH